MSKLLHIRLAYRENQNSVGLTKIRLSVLEWTYSEEVLFL